MIFFYLASDKKYYAPDKFNSAAIEKDCAKVIECLSDIDKYGAIFKTATEAIDKVADFNNREQIKLVSFTESLERELGIRPKLPAT